MAVARTVKNAQKPARNPKEAVRRLKDAGLPVRGPKRKGDFRPLDVPGLGLAAALDDLRDGEAS